MDITTQIIEAQDARSRMQEAKKRIKAEVRRKYEAAITQEVAERSADAEIEFARVLARVHASGVSQAILRREVLRTNVWNVWTYWRDLANIEPERVTIANAREALAQAAKPFRWADDYSTLTVLRNSVGDALEPAVVYDMATVTESRTGRLLADASDEMHERIVLSKDPKFLTFVSDEIRVNVDAGHVTINEGING